MSILLSVGLLVLLIQTVILICNLRYWHHKDHLLSPERPQISVLIPARNEVRNLPDLLSALTQQDFAPVEIIVCDDGSEDGTSEWLQEHALSLGVVYFAGEEKPEGWSGKTWACYQLGQRASGDWLLFLDADLQPAPGFLTKVAMVMAQTEAQLLTALPVFAPTTLWDGMLTAMVPFSVFSLLPLKKAENDLRESFAFANGQVMGFRRATYQQLQPHKQVSNLLLEDVGLARWVKRNGGKVAILEATDVLGVHMYRSLREAWSGFSRNGVLICGGPAMTLLVMALTVCAYLVPWWEACRGDFFAWVGVMWGAGLYGYCAARFGLGWFYALLTPVAMFLTLATLTNSLLQHRRGILVWKGRSYQQ